MTVNAAAPAHARRRLTAQGFRALVGMHLKLMRREPGVFVMIVLPVVLLIIFGVIPGTKTPEADLGGRSVLDVYLPTVAAMVPLMVACTGLPSAMASFRERNTLRRFSVSPVPPGGMLAALVAVLSVFAALGVLLILLLGTLVFGAKTPSNIGAVVSSFVLGFTAVIAIGMIPAAIATSNSMANGMGIPFMILNFFFAGLYVPIAQMPHVMQTIGEYVPFGAVMDAWSGTGALWQHLAVLAGYTVLGGVASAKLFRWE
ncbi:ABC transporter permease [Actinospica sp.]|jgi:ABC-2 type transport system permease protein|uniref:ABC transporter permease n=1 Tax=Actinospica sp. TaxID=1872142 RepID=UPI002B56A7D8|nr:ABC transporter permease [Actinospica sp.]HWG26915.1 ABC transporter permease [Actinospica sp.]